MISIEHTVIEHRPSSIFVTNQRLKENMQTINNNWKQSILVLAIALGPGFSFVSPTLASKRPETRRDYGPFDRNDFANVPYGGDSFFNAPNDGASFINDPNYHGDHGNNAMMDALNALSVTELKRILSERGVDFRDCLEKRDLVERLRTSAPVAYRQASFPMSDLSDSEQNLIGTFKRVSGSVANIKATTLVRQQRGLQLRGMEIPQGSGSGFLWDEKGHVVTNYHVLVGGQKGRALPRSVKVKLAGMAEPLDADVVGVEPEKDLAVLKVRNTRNLPRPVDVGTSNDLQVGQTVMAIGTLFFCYFENTVQFFANVFLLFLLQICPETMNQRESLWT